MKKYLQMSKTEYELIIKLIICTVLATIFSWAIGDLYIPTTAVTANLFLWCDRGYCGSLRYGTRRVLVQIIQGVLVIAVIFPCKHFALPIPDIILVATACCIALVIGLPINYQNQFSPFNCTLANATYVIACATVHNMDAFPKRVLQCIAGGLIGYFVNYIIFSYRDRVAELNKNIKSSVVDLIANNCFDTYNRNIALIDKDLGFLVEDSQKGNKKLQVSDDTISNILFHKKLMSVLHDYFLFHEVHKNQFSDQFNMQLQTYYKEAVSIHKKLLDNMSADNKIGTIIFPNIHTISPMELSALGRLSEYIFLLNSDK